MATKEIWKLGGEATKKKYGREYYVALGKKSGEAKRKKKKLKVK